TIAAWSGNRLAGTSAAAGALGGAVTVAQALRVTSDNVSYATIAMVAGRLAVNYPTQFWQQLYPGTPGGGYQTGGGWLAGPGDPSDAEGGNGDLYARTDAVRGATGLVWHKEAGRWQRWL